MAQLEDYRNIYAKYYNITISDLYDIHHIDRDRKNNKIDNLLLLPRDLHQRYHLVFPPTVSGYIIPAKINLYSNLPIQKAEEAVAVMKEISNWVRLKLSNYSGTDL